MPSHRTISASPRRSSSTSSQCELLFASRSWRNSWWKYRRSSPFPRCSGLWSSTSTVQSLVAEGGSLVFNPCCLLLRIAEQIVGIPVPRGGVRGLQGFHQGQDSTTSPLSLERISERMWSRSLILPWLVEAFKILVPDRVQWLRPFLHTFQLVPWTSRFTGFSHFSPPEKSAKLGPHSGSELSADFISSTPSACEVPHFSEDGNFFLEADKKPWMRLPSGWWYLLCSEPGEYSVDPRVLG